MFTCDTPAHTMTELLYSTHEFASQTPFLLVFKQTVYLFSNWLLFMSSKFSVLLTSASGARGLSPHKTTILDKNVLFNALLHFHELRKISEAFLFSLHREYAVPRLERTKEMREVRRA